MPSLVGKELSNVFHAHAGSGTLQHISREALAVLTAVISSVTFFVIGTIFGVLCLYFIAKHRTSCITKSGQTTVPVYEDVHVLPQSSIKLNDNLAYGPI